MTETVDAEGNHGGIVCEHAFACHIGIRSPRLRLGAGYACAADIPANVDAARMKQADRDAWRVGQSRTLAVDENRVTTLRSLARHS